MSKASATLKDLLQQVPKKYEAVFSNLMTRISNLANPIVACCVGRKIIQDQDLIKYYLQISDDDLLNEAGLIFSQTPNPESRSENKKTGAIGKDEGKERENKKEKEDEEEEEAFLPETYIKKSIQFLKHYRQLTEVSEELLTNFLDIYQQYLLLPLLKKSDIKKQAQKVKGKIDHNGFLSQVNIVDSALYYTSPKHRLRITQVLALYIFLYDQKKPKILLQILTGEGKSTTVACLSAILAMRGHNVDIITSSKILAIRDAVEKQEFFELIGIKVTHNISGSDKSSSNEVLEPRKCYENQTVVYGIPFSYQVDLLFDEYKRKGTRNKRPYEIAIVDEVDSMFVDEKENQTLLGSTYSGFSELKDALRIIWQTITNNVLKLENGVIFAYKQGKNKGDIIKCELKQYVRRIFKDIQDQFQSQVINKEKSEYLEISLDKWIQSAITALYEYQEDINYIVENDQVIPVDFRNTGCLQKNVQWENGLHQFLQMKHGLSVSVQGMTSNYMSNIGHFCRYQKIYGLTGTLGSKESMQFLKKTYDVSMFEIPSFHERKLSIDPGSVMYDHTDWLGKIGKRCEDMMISNRSVLVICLSIHQAETIEKVIRGKVNAKLITLMKTGEEKISDNVDVKEIIIATNVAGRGTDLKASMQLIKNGGLHVIIVFVPENLRIEMQARGRAGRNGNPGSSEIIMNLTEYSNYVGMPLMERNQFENLGFENRIPIILENIRNRREAEMMKNDQKRVENLRVRDKIFEIFCEATKKIPDYSTNNAKSKAIEQEWAMFLKRTEELKVGNEEKLVGAQDFAKRMVSNSESFYKKSHQVARGIHLLKSNPSDAMKHFQKAQDPDCTRNIQISGKLMEAGTIITQDGKNQDKIKQSINLMGGALLKLKQKKDILSGLTIMKNQNDNQNVVDLINQSSKKQISNPHQQFHSTEMEIESQGGTSLRLNKSAVAQQTSNAQIMVLEAVENHVKAQMQKVSKMNPQKQYLSCSFEPIRSLLDSMAGRQQNLEKEVEQWIPDMPVLPKIEVKKKKVGFWKRLLVFAIGVLQVCIGALIMAATSGAAAGFGAFMIASGIKDCINSIFRPQVIEDLKKYYTQKAIEYGIAASLAGFSAFQQIYSKGVEGFTLLRNTTMSEAMGMIGTQIGKGLVNSCGNEGLKGLLKTTAFQFLKQKQKQKDINVEEVVRIVKSPDIKQIFKEGEKNEEILDRKGQDIRKSFQKESQQMIKKVVEKQLSTILHQIRELNVCKEHVCILINNNFVKAFEEKFTSNQNQLFDEVRHFMVKNYTSKTLAKDLFDKFKIENLIVQTTKNMSKCEDYSKVLQQGNIEIHNKAIQKSKQVSEKYNKQIQDMLCALQNEKKQLEENQDSMTMGQYKKRVSDFENQVSIFQANKSKRNEFVESFNKFNQSKTYGNNLAEKLINLGILQHGKINKNTLKSSGLHQYFQEALENLQPFPTTDQGNFLCEVEDVVYNNFSKIVVKALIDIIDETSDCSSRLQQIKEQLYSKLNQNRK